MVIIIIMIITTIDYRLLSTVCVCIHVLVFWELLHRNRFMPSYHCRLGVYKTQSSIKQTDHKSKTPQTNHDKFPKSVNPKLP